MCCGKWKRSCEERWPASQIEHSQKQKSIPLVCVACKSDGYTPSDSQAYTCKGCGIVRGRGFYTPKDMNNKATKEKAGQSFTLFCTTCKEREIKLLLLVKSPAAWKCTCKCPICIPRCRLYPGSRRACNLGVRREDIAFLGKRETNAIF